MTKDELERARDLIDTLCDVSRLKKRKRHAACDENGGRWPWCGSRWDIPRKRVDPDWSRVTCLSCWEAKGHLPCPTCWPIFVLVSSSMEHCERCRSRPAGPARWTAALAELRTLQAEYQKWRNQLPEPQAESRTAELLDGVCDVDLDALDVKLPRGFGCD